MGDVDETGETRETGEPSGSDRLDPKTVAALHGEHARELRAFLTGMLRNAALVDDALQATFTKAVESGHTAREETRKGWLFRVAFTEAMQIKRRTRIDRRATETLANQTLASHNTTPTHTSEAREEPPVDGLVRAEAIRFVRDALDTLPEAQREVVRRRIYEEQTFAEIAEDLNLPLGTVLTRMRAAMQKLAGRLRNDDD